MHTHDFVPSLDGVGRPPATPQGPPSAWAAARGTKREYEKVLEPLPLQMLNPHGPAKYAKMADKDVWGALNQTWKSGAVSMTELTSWTLDRRGVGVHRWLHAMKLFCEYQKVPHIRTQNEALLRPGMVTGVYDEIELILPALQYCFAPKNQRENTGANPLRSRGLSDAPGEVSLLTQPLLRQHAATLYEWLDTSSLSPLRMLFTWQSAAGLSHVASVHHRAVQCFRYHGNTMHTPTTEPVTLTEFQDAIICRHQMG